MRGTPRCSGMWLRASSMRLRIGLGIGGFRLFGSQANDKWEMKITGPNAFERSYTLEGTAGEHRPEMIRVLLGKLVPR